MGSSNSSDELKTIRTDAQKLIGQTIVNSLIKRAHTLSDFNHFFGSSSYYNQSSGNYVQTDGGDYTQNGGGNYTQGPAAMSPFDELAGIDLGNIKEMGIKGSK